MRYDAVFLDFEGTLAFMDPPHARIYVDACAAHGCAITEDDLRRVVDDAWHNFETPYGVVHQEYSTSAERARELRRLIHAERLRTLGVPDGAVQAIAAAVAEEEVAPHYYHWFPDVLPALRTLAQEGLRLCIVSNHLWELPDIVAALGHDGIETTVITSARAGCRKPYPDIYHQALDRMEVEPHQVLFIGDHVVNDVEAPQRLGIAAVLLDRKGTYRGPHAAIRSLEQLPLPAREGLE